MTVIAFAAVILAALITVPLLALIHGLRHPRDPQAGVAALYFCILTPPRWLLLAGTLVIAASRGAFDWLIADRTGQIVLILLVHALAGGASLASQFRAAEVSAGWRGNLALATALALPICTGLCSMVGTAGHAGPVRDAWVIAFSAMVAGTTLAVGVGMLAGYIADAPRRAAAAREADAEAAAQREQYYRERTAQLEALPPDAPVYQFIQFTYANEPGDIAPRVRAMIAARPNFVADLADALRGNACYEGIWFLATGIDKPPPGLAGPARDAILRIAEHIRKQLKASTTRYPDQYFGETTRILAVVGKFGGTGIDFAPALRSLMDALRTPQADHAESAARSLIEDWLRRNATAHAPT